MKNYASKRAKKGKLAYRTPDRFIYKQTLKAAKSKCQIKTCPPTFVGRSRLRSAKAEASLARRSFNEGGAEAGKIEKIRVHLFVSGRVQGVFFRQETCGKAQELGLTGWVRNLEDGRVEAVFEGEKEKVEKMIEWAKMGPLLAKVENLEIFWEDYGGEFKSFETR